MCVRIMGNGTDTKYDSDVPLEQQLGSDSEVLIRYDAKDPDIDKFVCEVERLCKEGISANVKVEIQHKDHIKGIKAKKQMKRLERDLSLNEAIKLLVNMQRKTDIALEEISNFCLRKNAQS